MCVWGGGVEIAIGNSIFNDQTLMQVLFFSPALNRKYNPWRLRYLLVRIN